MKHLIYIFVLLVMLDMPVMAASVDTVSTYSISMKKNIKAVVIRPDNYSTKKSFPVLYLLHGYGNDYASWVNRAPEVVKQADLYNIIIVCADGNLSSWYFDSPVDTSWKYETYISSELVNYIDSNYKTIKDRNGRAIAGASMGGHGALYIAIKHQDIFGAAGSMSGGVDIRPFPKKWEIEKRLGVYKENPELWEKNTVINLVGTLTGDKLKIIIDCGTEDFFFKVNENLHEKLIAYKIPHDYITRKGGHGWEYWNVSIQKEAYFFNRFFKNRCHL